MPGNPNVPQGTLIRVRAAVIIPNFSSLNVTASYLGDEMIRISFGGPATTRINVATGQVISPEPYIPAVVRINLLKTQSLAAAFKTQMEATSVIGDVTVIPDATTFPPYTFSNCSLDNVEPIDMNGKNPGWTIDIGGTYQVNADLWG